MTSAALTSVVAEKMDDDSITERSTMETIDMTDRRNFKRRRDDEPEDSETESQTLSDKMEMIKKRMKQNFETVSTWLLGSKEPMGKKKEINAVLLDMLHSFNEVADTVSTRLITNDLVSKLRHDIRQLANNTGNTLNDMTSGGISTTEDNSCKHGWTKGHVHNGQNTEKKEVEKVRVSKNLMLNIPTTMSVIIGPNPVTEGNFTSSKETKDTLLKALRPREVGMKVTKIITHVRYKCVRIEASAVNMEAIKSSVALKAAGLEVKDRQKLNPRMIIKGIPSDVSEDDILQDLIKGNLEDLTEPEIMIVHVIPSNRNKDTKRCIIEVSPTTRTALLKTKKIYIGWKVCYVEDHLRVLQCYKCLDFGHIATNCNNVETCGHCGGLHDSRKCESSNSSGNKKCMNCVKANEDNHSHTAFDSDKCPILKVKLQQRASIVNYGS